MQIRRNIGSIALLSHFGKVLSLSKFTLLKCENEVNPIEQIPGLPALRKLKLHSLQCLVAQGIRATGLTSISHFKRANFESANTL